MESYALKTNNTLPAMGSYSAYKSYVMNLPIISEGEEKELLEKFKLSDCMMSAQKLILSQLKTVMHVAYQYRNYGLPEEDLVQEGNIGLMKAVKNFDINQKVRLYSYAIIWIKAEIQSYILKNWKLVKIGTTKNLKKLFFNLKQIQKEMISLGIEKRQLVKLVAKKLNVEEDEVRQMQQYFSSGDTSVDLDENDEGAPFLLELSHEDTPEKQYMEEHDGNVRNYIVNQAIDSLNERQTYVIKNRFMEENKKTHKELAEELGVSSERVRQIENEAMGKMRNLLVKNYSMQAAF